MDPGTVVKAGSEALTLLTALTKLIKENQGKPKTSLSELLAYLRVEALRISIELEGKLRLLETGFWIWAWMPTRAWRRSLKIYPGTTGSGGHASKRIEMNFNLP